MKYVGSRSMKIEAATTLGQNKKSTGGVPPSHPLLFVVHAYAWGGGGLSPLHKVHGRQLHKLFAVSPREGDPQPAKSWLQQFRCHRAPTRESQRRPTPPASCRGSSAGCRWWCGTTVTVGHTLLEWCDLKRENIPLSLFLLLETTREKNNNHLGCQNTKKK